MRLKHSTSDQISKQFLDMYTYDKELTGEQDMVKCVDEGGVNPIVVTLSAVEHIYDRLPEDVDSKRKNPSVAEDQGIAFANIEVPKLIRTGGVVGAKTHGERGELEDRVL